MNELSTFNFNMFPVRVINIGSEPWFVAKDIADILEYSDAEAMTRRLDADEIQNRQIVGFGNRGANIINESGLYNAILGSNKPEAKTFKKWVTSEVLPTIRKTGGYIATKINDTPETIMARALIVAQETLKNHAERLALQEDQLKIQAPAVEYANKVLCSTGLHTANSIAVHLGISAIKLNRFLLEKEIIYKQGSIYQPSYKIRGQNLCDFHIIPYLNKDGERMTQEHLKWTEAGRRFIVELWNKHNNKQVSA